MALRRGAGTAASAARLARRGLDPARAARAGKARKFISSSNRRCRPARSRTAVRLSWSTICWRSGSAPIHEDSSGNAGASIATYAAAAGIPCRIYVPAAAPSGKLMQIAVSGADVRTIPGTRQDGDRGSTRRNRRKLLCQPQLAAFFIEGTKTLAFELWEQLGFRVPDNILVPTGYGSNILGLDRGFDELETERRDRRAAEAFRRPGGKLRGVRRCLDSRGGPISCRSRRDRPLRTGSPRLSPCGSPRCCERCAARREVSLRSPKRTSRRRSPRWAGSGFSSSRPLRRRVRR